MLVRVRKPEKKQENCEGKSLFFGGGGRHNSTALRNAKVILVNKMVKQLTIQFSANFNDALKRITLQSQQFGVARPLVDTSRHALPATRKAQTHSWNIRFVPRAL